MSSERELERLREQIDNADRDLVDALAERFEVIKKIRDLKKKAGLDVLDEERWNDVLRKRIAWAGIKDVSADLVRIIFEQIHKRALEIENK